MHEGARASERLGTWAGRLVPRLQAEWGVPSLCALASTGSTNDVARSLAEAGAAHGTTVVADHQTAGRGRHGRAWADRPGASLLLSMVLRPDGPRARGHAPPEPGVLPLLVGLACARAIRTACGLEVGIEWPNDLVLDDRKLGGVLCEAARHGGALDFVVAGVGINVGDPPDGIDDGTGARAAAATSLAAAIGAPAPPDRARLAGEVVRRMSRLRPDAPLSAAEHEELRRRDALAGRRVRLGTGREGVALGILADGALQVEDGAERFSVRAGSVSPLPTRAP